MPANKNIKTLLVPYTYNENNYNFVLVTSKIDNQNYEYIEILSDRERRYYDRVFPKRKYDYLIGRLAAKTAILLFTHQDINNIYSYKNINILNGVFSQPLVECEACSVSISHSDMYGCSVAYANTHSFGIDIEKISSRVSTFEKYILTEDERTKLLQPASSKVKNITIAWTLKEALSKAIQVGFTVDVSIFEIEHITQVDPCYFQCQFKFFPAFSAVTYLFEDYVLSLVFPKTISFDPTVISLFLKEHN